MKVLLRIIIALCLLAVLFFATAYFVLTREGVQMRIARSLLPAEAELERVKVGLGGIELDGVSIPQSGGGLLAFEQARFRMPVLKLFLGRTVDISDLRLTGLDLRIPETAAGITAERPATRLRPVEQQTGPPSGAAAPAAAEADFYRALLTLKEAGYTIRVDQVAIDGQVTDGYGRVFDLSVTGGGFGPGKTGRLDTRMALSGSNFQTGVGSLTAETRFEMALSKSSVPETLVAEARFMAADTLANPLADARLTARMEVDAAARSSRFSFAAEMSLPDPSVIAPRLEVLRGVRIEGRAEGRGEGGRWLLEQAGLLADSGERRVVAVELTRPLELGGTDAPVGDLLTVLVSELPPEWLTPLLPEGVSISGSPLNLELAVSRTEEGAITLSRGNRIELGPLSLARDGESVLPELRVSATPGFTVWSDGRFSFFADPAEITTGDGTALSLRVRGAGDPGSFTVEVFEANLRDGSGGSLLAGQLVQPLTLRQDAAGLFPVPGSASDGEIANIRIDRLSSEWINPLLSDGWRLADAGVSGELSIESSGGGLTLATVEPLRLAGLSVAAGGGAVLDAVDVEMPLLIRADEEGVTATVEGARISSGVRRIASIDADFSAPAASGGENAATVNLRTELVLTNLLRQPAFAGFNGLLDGVAELEAVFDSATRRLDASLAIDDFRTREDPQRRRRYGAQSVVTLAAADRPGLDFELRFNSGFPERPATDLLTEGNVEMSDSQVMTRISVSGERAEVADLVALANGFRFTQPEPGVAEPGPGGGEPGPPVSGDGGPVAPAQPSWAGLDAVVQWSIDQVVLQNGATIENLAGRAVANQGRIAVDELTAAIGEGTLASRFSLEHDGTQAEPYSLILELSVDSLRVEQLAGRDIEEAALTGGFDLEVDLSGVAGTVAELADTTVGTIALTGRDGTIAGFDLDKLIEEKLGQLGGFARLGLGIAGNQGRYPGLAALTRLVPYFKDIPFDRFVLDLERAGDRRTRISELRATGGVLDLEGDGTIAPSSLADVLQAPLDLRLAVASKDPLTRLVRELNPQLVAGTPDTSGFVSWTRSFALTGSLDEVDASSLTDLLWESAIRAMADDIGAGRGGAGGSPIDRLLEDLIN